MGIRVPRITINADFGDDTAFGDLSLLSVGYGLHQAWVYAAMFGTSSIFGTQTYITGMYGSHASLPFLISIVVFGVCLLFAGITDQRLLKAYISKKTLVAGSVLMSAGTLLLLSPPAINGPALEVVSGIATGIGSAILILFWGVAFARCDSASIVLNSSIAISIGIGVYAIGLHYGPFPIAGILTGIIPLLELAILWNKTPAPYSERNEVPIFKPLPVNHAKFFLRFGIPVFVFGVALGTLRQTSIQYIVPASNVADQIVMLLAAGFASVVILVTIVALGGGDKWSRYFRPLIPFIAVTLFFLPLSEMSDGTFATMFLVMGYLCFEALMWIFFGELAQRFRLSPIYVFGLGRGMLALAGLAGSLFPIVAANWVHLLPFGEQGVIVVVLLIMVVAYALLPREREIEAIVAPCPLVKAVSLELNDRVRPLGHAGAGAGAGAGGGDDAVSRAELEGAGTNMDAAADNAAQTVPAAAPTAARTPSLLERSSARRADEGDGEGRKGGGRFRTKCETVANTYLLSRRETEIMFFLAKGHNAAYIQEKLYISEGTAKTHIRHVYKKTNVHSQQELMRLVELAEAAE
ncbi:helix-turn-helix transcriptional regulator [Eggerthella sp. NSJ-70]|uniref:Helix-turn-helix transcriptional regulator n=1 Tax=Eggerthella hominis TaxID=2763043 RepID=A0ABR7BSR1_9ACTN|nr:LuxR family transcriptional regulator [Eggerthella hominis]MBC5584641.1 helix-turn-helix transcriptional regulator [Eggerthella hominis]